jgi:cholesterol transport system auxiliary component
MSRWNNHTLAVTLRAAMVLALSGCALTSKADLVDIRYFSPERVKAELASETTQATPEEAFRVRLGRVSSGSNLRERIAYRDDEYELGYYEELRWTERPETYVRRDLARSLFETHGMHRVLSGDAPTLEVEVLAFDDQRLSTGRSARVQLRVILYEDAGVIFEDTLTFDRRVAGDEPMIEDVIPAMASALEAASEEVSSRVRKALETRAVATPTAKVP